MLSKLSYMNLVISEVFPTAGEEEREKEAFVRSQLNGETVNFREKKHFGKSSWMDERKIIYKNGLILFPTQDINCNNGYCSGKSEIY